MNKQIILGLIAVIVGLGTIVGFQGKRISQVTDERNQYQQNTYTLLADIETLQQDSAIQAYQVDKLTLSLDEYRKYRSEDAQTIADLKLKLKQVSAISKSEISVNVPINTPVRDTVIVVDSIYRKVQTIAYNDSNVSFNGTIWNDSLKANLHVPVTISQVLYKVPKHKFLWWSWGCKAVKQVVITNNPYVQLNYSEYIEIK